MSGLFLLLAFIQAAVPGTLIQVDSRNQGRTFIVDTTLPAIRKELRDVVGPGPAGPVPGWLPLYPGAVLVDRPEPSAPSDFKFQGYASSAAPDAVFAYYENAVRAAPGVTMTS